MKRFTLTLIIAVVIIAAGGYFFFLSGGGRYETRTARTFIARKGIVNSAVFTPDLQRAVMHCSMLPPKSGYTVTGWDLESRTALYELTPKLFGREVAISADGSLFALPALAGVTPQVGIYETETGTERGKLPCSAQNLFSIAFSPDGEALITIEGEYPNTAPGNVVLGRYGGAGGGFGGGYGGGGAPAKPGLFASVWNWKNAERTAQFPIQGTGITFAPDGKKFVTVRGNVAGNDNKIRTWDVKTGRMLSEFAHEETGPRKLRYLPDGLRVAVAGKPGYAAILDTASNTVVRKFDPFPNENRTVADLAVSPDGNLMAVGYQVMPRTGPPNLFDKLRAGPLGNYLAIVLPTPDMTAPVAVWDVTTGERLHLFGLNAVHTQVAFSPDGRQLVTIDYSGEFRWWNIRRQ